MLSSIETYILREKFDDKTAIKMISEAGFGAIDYSFYACSPHKNMLKNNYIEYAYSLKDFINENGIHCNQTHAPYDLTEDSSFDLFDKNYRNLIRSIEFSSILGAKTIVIHGINTSTTDYFEFNYNFYKSLEPYCKKFNIKIAIENLFFTNKNKIYEGRLSTPHQLCKFIEKLQSKHFTACVDLGHAAITGTKPEDFILGMDSQYLTNLHIHDNDMHNDLHLLPYSGKFNWEKIINALKYHKYDGDISLEVFGYLSYIPEKLLPNALKLSQNLCQHLINKLNK